jgi:hypothetical protein
METQHVDTVCSHLLVYSQIFCHCAWIHDQCMWIHMVAIYSKLSWPQSPQHRTKSCALAQTAKINSAHWPIAEKQILC